MYISGSLARIILALEGLIGFFCSCVGSTNSRLIFDIIDHSGNLVSRPAKEHRKRDLLLIFTAAGIFSLTWNELLISFDNVNSLGPRQTVVDVQPMDMGIWFEKMHFWWGLMGRDVQECRIRFVDGKPKVWITYIEEEPVAAEDAGSDGVL